jgi:hypothetical protein
MKKILGLFCLGVSLQASAADFSPRIGASFNSYTAGNTESGAGLGVSTGLIMSANSTFLDLNLEVSPFGVQKPTTGFEKGWRTEAALTAGYAVYKTVYVIGGYRDVGYSKDFGKRDAAKLNGGFVGLLVSNLRLGDSDKDIFSFSFAVQPTTYEPVGRPSETDVGASIRLGYRRAGSPHSFALRHQGFGGDLTYDEYQTSLQYSYQF